MLLFGKVSHEPNVHTLQIFRSQYAPRYTIPFVVCEIFLARESSTTLAPQDAHKSMLYLVTIGAILFTWYFCHDTENETRRIAAARHAAGKRTGEILEEDVHIGRL